MAAASGTQYFRQVVITWSIRSRGSVQRSQIMTITPSDAFDDEVAHAQQVAEPAGHGSVLVRQARATSAIGHRPVPAAEEQDRRQPADGEHRPRIRP